MTVLVRTALLIHCCQRW